MVNLFSSEMLLGKCFESSCILWLVFRKLILVGAMVRDWISIANMCLFSEMTLEVQCTVSTEYISILDKQGYFDTKKMYCIPIWLDNLRNRSGPNKEKHSVYPGQSSCRLRTAICINIPNFQWVNQSISVVHWGRTNFCDLNIRPNHK